MGVTKVFVIVVVVVFGGGDIITFHYPMIHYHYGLIAQLVEHCTGIVEIMGSNPVQA